MKTEMRNQNKISSYENTNSTSKAKPHPLPSQVFKPLFPHSTPIVGQDHRQK